MNISDLAPFGLTETEAKVYLYLYKRFRASVKELSEETGIKRPTIYAAANELINKGLIEEDFASKTKHYIALSADQFKNLVDKERRQISEKERLVQTVIDKLELVPRANSIDSPEIKIAEGSKVRAFLYDHLPVWVDSMVETGEKTWWGFRDKRILENKMIVDWIAHHWEDARGTDLKLLGNSSPIEEKISSQFKRRQTKYCDDIEFNSTQWIMGDYVVNLSFKNKKEFYIVEIKDRNLAENSRTLYKLLWGNLQH